MSPDLADEVRRRLLDRRVVLVSGRLDAAGAGHVAAQLMTLDADGDGAVVLRIGGCDGSYEAAFTVMDTIDLMGVPVHARCSGRVEGPAVGVVAVSHHRWAAPHSALWLREPVVARQGSERDLEAWVASQRRQRQRFLERLAEVTTHDETEIAADLDAGRFLDPEDALAYGLVDEVGADPSAIR